MGSIDYCEGDSGKNIRSCNVALLIRVHGDFVMGSGIEGIYPMPFARTADCGIPPLVPWKLGRVRIQATR
jgi:hypothetical protein